MDPRTKLVQSIKKDAVLSGVIEETKYFITMLLKKSKDNKSQNQVAATLKKVARQIQEECPYAFPVLNLFTRILILLNTCEEDHDPNKSKLLSLLSCLDSGSTSNTDSKNSNTRTGEY
jgi:hypothetical protein